MSFDSQLHHRRSIRLREYDYTQAGAYFVTICVYNRESLLGEIADGVMKLSAIGEIVAACWNAIPEHFRHVELDEMMVMPNHVHGILVFAYDAYVEGVDRGEAFAETSAKRGAAANANASPLLEMPRGTRPRSLNSVIQNFKSVSTRKVNKSLFNPGSHLWQRDYYEHVIRNEHELERIREYIFNNPYKWAADEYNPKK